MWISHIALYYVSDYVNEELQCCLLSFTTCILGGCDNTCTTVIFSDRRMFSTLFNIKTNIIWWIVWFLHTGKEKCACEMEYFSSGKKMNSKITQHICAEFCIRLAKLHQETTLLLKKAFRDKRLSNSNIKKSLIENSWHQHKPSLTISWSPNFV